MVSSPKSQITWGQCMQFELLRAWKLGFTTSHWSPSPNPQVWHGCLHGNTFWSEAWNKCGDLRQAYFLNIIYPILHASPEIFLHKIIKIVQWWMYKLYLNGLLRLKSWDFDSMLGFANMSANWDLEPHMERPKETKLKIHFFLKKIKKCHVYGCANQKIISTLDSLEHIVISLDHLKTKLSTTQLLLYVKGKLLLTISRSHRYGSNI